MSDFNDWLNAMSLLERIFWLIAIPSSVLFGIQLMMTFFFGDIDDSGGDIDADVDADSGIGFQFITFKNLVAFFCHF